MTGADLPPRKAADGHHGDIPGGSNGFATMIKRLPTIQ
jgi:hypothetical protein